MHQILDTLNHMGEEEQKFILDYILLYQSHLQEISTTGIAGGLIFAL